MAFKSTVATTQGTPPPPSGPKPVGGRYAGIRPPQADVPKVKAGDYILEGITSKVSRTGSTAMIYVKVIQAEGDGATPPSQEKHLLMINYGGDAFDTGAARLVSLSMALCNASTVEEMAKDDPKYDELIDVICGKLAKSDTYGDDPIAGRKFFAHGWNSATLDKRGDPFVNWEFGIAAEE